MQQTHDSGTVNYHNGRSIDCGKDFRGVLQFCKSHERENAIRYPQGYRYYPGDVCKHGMYTGGSGRDVMCGQCELGI